MANIEKLIHDHINPIVPPELMRYTCGLDNSLDFTRSGAEVYIMLNLAAERHGRKSLPEFSSVLDFGCGTGRILRFFDKVGGRLCGCDINEALIAFTGENFPVAETHVSPLMPPLSYKDADFDLVYSFSVFSHLSLDVEDAWLRELERVGQPGCLYLITVHGDWYIEQTLSDDDAAEARAKGFTWRRVHGRSGGTNDFPDYYEASYHTSNYIRGEWSRYFDILDIIKGDDPMRYVGDDASLATIARQVRPMGQDLVVTRKRA